MLALLVCDVIGGFLAFASGVHSWDRAWGFDAKTTVPLPIGVAQLVLAWLAARNARPPVGRIAAVVLAGFCAISVIAGTLDGDLAAHVSSGGWLSWKVIWAIFLLFVTAAVGVLAAVRGSQLRRCSAAE